MKRTISVFLAFVMVLSCCYGVAGATTTPTPSASFYLSGYEATLRPGTGSGAIVIGFDVTASKFADSIGVSQIVIYRSNGAYVTTITGTVSNGLVSSSSGTHEGDYTYYGSSGTSYYAQVTVFARCATGSDSRTITTKAVMAP